MKSIEPTPELFPKESMDLISAERMLDAEFQRYLDILLLPSRPSKSAPLGSPGFYRYGQIGLAAERTAIHLVHDPIVLKNMIAPIVTDGHSLFISGPWFQAEQQRIERFNLKYPSQPSRRCYFSMPILDTLIQSLVILHQLPENIDRNRAGTESLLRTHSPGSFRSAENTDFFVPADHGWYQSSTLVSMTPEDLFKSHPNPKTAFPNREPLTPAQLTELEHRFNESLDNPEAAAHFIREFLGRKPKHVIHTHLRQWISHIRPQLMKAYREAAQDSNASSSSPVHPMAAVASFALILSTQHTPSIAFEIGITLKSLPENIRKQYFNTHKSAIQHMADAIKPLLASLYPHQRPSLEDPAPISHILNSLAHLPLDGYLHIGPKTQPRDHIAKSVEGLLCDHSLTDKQAEKATYDILNAYTQAFGTAKNLTAKTFLWIVDHDFGKFGNASSNSISGVMKAVLNDAFECWDEEGVKGKIQGLVESNDIPAVQHIMERIGPKHRQQLLETSFAIFDGNEWKQKRLLDLATQMDMARLLFEFGSPPPLYPNIHHQAIEEEKALEQMANELRKTRISPSPSHNPALNPSHTPSTSRSKRMK